MRNMGINPGHAARHKKKQQNADENRKMQNVRADGQCEKEEKDQNGKSGRVALSGVALGDVEKRHINIKRFFALVRVRLTPRQPPG